MKNILIFFLLTFGTASCQTVQSDSVRQCIFDNGLNREITSPTALLLTPIFAKDDKGLYAFRVKGPHSFNRLAIKEDSTCKVIPKDSTSQFLQTEVARFAEKHQLTKKERKSIQKKLKDYILDFRDSDYIN
jgi:hypothetical protein